MSWSVGKTMLGFERPSSEVAAVSERQAQHKLGEILRQHLTAYELVKGKEDLPGWYGSLMKVNRMIEQLENGKWPAGSDGLNWFWSIPWGEGQHADRDCWVFWAKADPQGGSGGSGDVVPFGPRGGRAKDLAAA